MIRLASIAALVSTASAACAPFNGSASPIWPRPASESYGDPSNSVGIMPSMFAFQLVNSTGGPVVPPPSLKAAFDRYVEVTFPKKSGEICGYLLSSLALTIG